MRANRVKCELRQVPLDARMPKTGRAGCIGSRPVSEPLSCDVKRDTVFMGFVGAEGRRGPWALLVSMSVACFAPAPCVTQRRRLSCSFCHVASSVKGRSRPFARTAATDGFAACGESRLSARAGTADHGRRGDHRIVGPTGPLAWRLGSVLAALAAACHYRTRCRTSYGRYDPSLAARRKG